MSLKTKSTIKYASPIVREIDDFSQLEGLTGQYDNQQLSIVSFLPNGFIGGGKMFWDASQLKSGHDGDLIISPTVPWTLTYSDYQAGTGETDPAGSGCWVRVGRAVGTVYEPGIDAPTGAIIQRGSNANGEFVRFADGTQRASSNPIDLGSRIAFGLGTLADPYRTNQQPWNFPISFSSQPAVTFSVYVNTGVAAARCISVHALQTPTTTAVTAIQATAHSSDATDVDIFVVCNALGRWY